MSKSRTLPQFSQEQRSDKLQFVVALLFIQHLENERQRQTKVCRTSATARLIIVGCIMLLCAGIYSDRWDVIAQKRRVPQPPRTASTRIDYSRFSHATKQHQEACKTCHKAPTSNWQKARGFPDVADYPDHNACVRCHRQQFFKGFQPAICSDCHTKVSPRNDVRFAFRNPARPRQFTIEFPHDKHQDVIAWRKHEPAAVAHLKFQRVSFVAFTHAAHAAHAGDEPKKNYNYCTICHAANTREPSAPAGGWSDRFVPGAEMFKSVPEAHSSCFNCHWNAQKPTRDDCAGCHKPASPYLRGTAPERKSMKFKHSREQHMAECTSCHINITKATSLRGLKPDVPITGCTACHNKSGLREDLGKELAALDKNKDFVCVYCHTSEIGKRDPPAGHYLVADRVPLKRKDVK